MKNHFGDYLVCDWLILGRKPSLECVSEEKFNSLIRELQDYLICVEGEEYSSYDNSDDERCGSSSSLHKFKYYREIDFKNDSEHLILKDNKIIGIVFYISKGNNDYEYYQFLFDGSLKQKFRMGYSASHSSRFVYVENLKLVRRGENGVPAEGRKINFYHSSMDTYI